MTQLICDRCGSIISRSPLKITINGLASSDYTILPTKEMDLCWPCRYALTEFLEHPPTTVVESA